MLRAELINVELDFELWAELTTVELLELWLVTRKLDVKLTAVELLLVDELLPELTIVEEESVLPAELMGVELDVLLAAVELV